MKFIPMPMRRTIGNMLFMVWLWGFCVLASAASFKEEILGYDVESLMWAALMALFGGTLRTIFTLAADTRLITSMLRESWKDVVVALIAGSLMYITIEALKGTGIVHVPSEIRFAAIVFSGWSRMSFFGWLNTLGSRMSTAVTDTVVSRVSSIGKPPPPAAKPAPVPEKVPFTETAQ